MLKLRFFFLIFLIICAAYCQPALSNQIRQRERLWFGFNFTGPLSHSRKFYYWLQAEPRFSEHATALEELLLRGAIAYQTSQSTRVWFGYQWFGSTSIDELQFRFEHRLFEELDYKTFYVTPAVRTRTRLEQRLREKNSQINWRLRQHVTLLFSPIIWSNVYPTIAEEAFFSLNAPRWTTNKFFSQNRLFLGVTIKVSNVFKIKTGYLNQYIFGRRRDLTRHILLFQTNCNF